MKFRQKIFFSSIFIFMLIFNIGVYIITSYSYKFSLEQETDSAVREQAVILSSVRSGIANTEKISEGASQNNIMLLAVMEPLGAYYSPQGVSLYLYNGEISVYSGIFEPDPELLSFDEDNSANILNRKTADDKRYLFVSAKIPEYNHLTFIYARDISKLDSYRADIGQVFIILNAVVCVIFGVVFFVLLKQMTRPIKKLNEITSEISGGAYDMRVSIKQHDEFGELADSFNKMADSVEENVKTLKNAAEDRQTFIDNLAHEMRTPLTSILGYSQYLQSANSSEDERITAAGHLHDTAERLHNLSAKLLDIAYLRHEAIELLEIDIASLFEALSELMKPIFSQRNITLKTSVETKTLLGDETLLLSLLANLTENSARASNENQTVELCAYSNNGQTVIEVSDSGRGMTEEEAKKITEPFYRADKSRSRSFGGVGLGMTICMQIAELHNAVMEIESEENKGTTVRILLP